MKSEKFLKMLRILLFLLFNLILVNAGNSSLSFVIDDSGSMGEEISQVRQGARGIMDTILNYKSSQIEDIVLVTFNDPMYLNELKINNTRDPDKLQEALNSISPHNFHNSDWEEFSLSGIELALQHSRPNSYLFVFTDASAKDFDKVELIKGMCQKAQSQIMFILTDYCIDNYDVKCKVYHQIALACSGQVFIVDKDDVNKVIDYIKETVKGDKSIIKTAEVPAYKDTKIQFEIDDKTEYVLISASGENVRITDKHGPSSNYKVIMSTANTEALRLDNPIPGTYWVIVHGTSQVIVHVFSRTDFLFEHGFSKLMPKSITDTSKQPIADSKSYLAIQVTDPEHEVQIQNAIILDINGNIIYNLPLKRISGDFYITDQFVAPNKLFQISVTGKIIKTRKDIERFAKTPIQPQKPEIIPIEKKAPVTSITEGSETEIVYKGTLQLSCAVYGYPEPKIIWRDSNGNVLDSTSSPVELPYKYVSYVTLNNVRTDASYVCDASNKLSRHQSTVKVVVISPFTITAGPPGTSHTRYNKEAIIRCKITSKLRMRIDWFRNINRNMLQIYPSDKYEISSDGTELKIKSVDLDSNGQYKCKAVLIDDPNQQKVLTTNVKVNIDNKAPVTSITEGPLVEVAYDGTVQLTCTVTAYPAPTIIWKDANGKDLTPASSTIEFPYKYKSYVILKNIRSFDAGNFICVASNKLSSHQSAVHVSVLSPYTIGVVPPATSTAQFNKEAVIKCNIKSTSRMRIDWYRKVNTNIFQIKTSGNYVISSDGTELKIKPVTLDSAGQYTCKSVLIDDPSQDKEYTTDVTVAVDHKAPVTSITEGSHIEVPYDGTFQLTCTVTAYPAPTIIWKDADGKILTSESSTIELPYKYKSYVVLKNVRSSDAGKFICVASNKLSSQQSAVHVSVLSPYTVGFVPPAVSTAQFNNEAVIKCNIKSTSPMRIDWFRKVNQNNVQIKTSGNYVISSDGTELKIKPITLDSAGQYLCKAVVIGDPSQDKEYTTDLTVAVDDKVPVASIIEGHHVTVAYNGTLQLTCRVIAYPAPNIIWKDNAGNVLPSSSSPVELPYKYVSYFTVSNVITNGTGYVCVASNKLSTQETAVNVTVLSPFTSVIAPPANSTGLYGGKSVIKCKITSPSRIHIKWFRKINGNVLQIDKLDKLYTISPDETELKINLVTLNTAGEYICKAELIDDISQNLELYTDLMITDLAVPVLQKSTPTIIVKVNKTIDINCKIISGNPKPVITWQFKRTGLHKNTVLQNKGEELKISRAALTDAGVYLCTAVNEIGSDKHETQLIVEAPPTVKFDNGDDHYLAVEGDLVLRIPCNAVGYPKPDIIWSTNGSIIVPDEKFAIEDGTLIIKNPISNDTRVYTCDAKNKFGNVSQPFEVIVNPYLDLEYNSGDMHKIYILEKDSKDIKCLIANTTTDDVRWYWNGLERNVTETFFRIIDAKQDNDGNYTCRVNTPLESISDTYEVDVGYPPRFRYDTLTKIEWNGEDGNLLDCSANAKPFPEVQWLYDGAIIVNETKMQIGIAKWGNYECKVSNPHGNIIRSFEVSSSACLIDINSLKLNNNPLMLSEDWEWPKIVSMKSTYIVPKEYNLRLLCLNQNLGFNYFRKLPGRGYIIAVCDNWDHFLVDGTSYRYSDLTCHEDVSFSVVKTGTSCLHNNSELIKVGFYLEHFVEVYSVCYDNDLNVPLYAHLGMSSMNTIASAAAHSWFRYPGVGNGRGVQSNSCGEGSSCCYGKSQLINARDVSYGPAQKSTFIDHLNSIVLWHPCRSNETTWLSLEKLLRTKYEEEPQFHVWSGASGYNITEDGEAVPRYLWKVFKINGELLAAIFINDQYPQINDILCTNICENNDVLGLGLLIHDQTYCCEMEEFSEAFGINSDLFLEDDFQPM